MEHGECWDDVGGGEEAERLSQVDTVPSQE